MNREEMKLIFQKLKELDDAIEDGECHDVDGKDCCENCPFSSRIEDLDEICILGEIVSKITEIKKPEGMD